MAQTTFGVGGLKCRQCGGGVSSASLGQDSAGLTSVTSSVRSYVAGASEEEKSKRYNQQKWKLFETNYQREKGITTEQSLQEIENFANHGIAPTPKGIAGVGGSSRPAPAPCCETNKPASYASSASSSLLAPKLSSPARHGLGLPRGGSKSGMPLKANQLPSQGGAGGAAFFAGLDKNKRKQHF